VPQAVEEKIIASQPKQREILQQCHVCRQHILASQMNQHLKSCLGQKKKTNQAEIQRGDDVDIRQHLDNLSARRPDIFGAQDTQISARSEEP
jgi:hypothetical protein